VEARGVTQLRLETARLVLRLPEAGDAEAIVRGFANINVVRNLDNTRERHAGLSA
jgi:hypothetical protein